jgi:hypothetical protein
LQEIADAEQREPAEDQDGNEQDVEDLAVGDPEADQKRGDHRADREDDESRRKRKQQGLHETLFQGPTGRFWRFAIFVGHDHILSSE